MNHYPFHIGDFRGATRHLTTVERALYRELIDMYYDTERPLPSDDLQMLERKLLCRADEEKAALKAVLAEFFVLQDDGYHNERCDAEITLFKAKSGMHWAAKLSKAQRASIQSMRDARKASATPRWLTKQDLAEIAAIYAEAAMLTASTGQPHEVDHIVPLRSKLVCGLHVAWNLQVLPAIKNRQKSNFFEVA
ncbi:MAG: YdaU family protein [Burkholderiaceae bacterium]